MTCYYLEGTDKLPQWAKNRIFYEQNRQIINALIQENTNWVNLYKRENQIKNSILHQEKIFYLEKLLSEMDEGTKIK